MSEELKPGIPRKPLTPASARDSVEPDMSYVDMAEGRTHPEVPVAGRKESADAPGMFMGFPLHHTESRVHINLWECAGDRHKFDDVVTDLILNHGHLGDPKLSVNVRVQRSSGSVEDDWFINTFVGEDKEFIVQKGALSKRISLQELHALNF